MPITLDNTDLKVLIVLLEKAGEEFGRHGCNDFDLVKDAGLAPGEAQEFITKMQVESPGEEHAFDGQSQYDWMLFARYSRLFQRALERN